MVNLDLWAFGVLMFVGWALTFRPPPRNLRSTLALDKILQETYGPVIRDLMGTQ